MPATGFHDVLLHPGFSYGVLGGPEFKTRILRKQSGIEKRNIDWEIRGGEWDASRNLETQEELDELIAFFHTRYGRGYSFRFLDWADFNIESQSLGSFPGLATGEQLQIIKTYTDFASYTFDRTIYKPVDTSNANHTLNLNSAGDPSYTDMSLTVATVAKVEGVDYSVDYSTGIITSLVVLSGAAVVNCSFHCHARFDTDKMPYSIDFFDRYGWRQIPIIELKQE